MKPIRTLSAVLLLVALALFSGLSQNASAGAVASPSQPSLTQYFQDVAVGSFWYNYTASLYQEGITTGFPCGTPPAGQCVPPANLPYFVPNNNITRGQTAAFFSRSLAPGVYITGPYTGTNGQRGAFNATNTNLNDNSNAGLYGKGPHGVDGIADSNGSQNSAGGYFDNPITYTTNNNYGAYANAANGYGLYAQSNGSTGQQESIAVVGKSTQSGGVGGVFSGTVGTGVIGAAGGASGNPSGFHDGVDGLSAASAGDGIYGRATGGGAAYGVWGTVEGATNSAIGGVFDSYDGGAAHLGLQVHGQGHATGGFSTGLGYDMMVKYDGSQPLQRGDVLALDGNNQTVAGNQVFGTVKADSSNAKAAIGVAQFHYIVLDGGAGKPPTVQVDDQATTFQPGDLLDVVVLGSAQMKLGGSASIGDSISIGGKGLTTASDSNAIAVGKVASAPDKDGYVTVFVNLK